MVVLDQIERVPALFQTLLGLIDQGRRKGKRTGRFLILDAASMDLLRQSSETLAGRIASVEKRPLNVTAVGAGEGPLDRLWIRGGFPDSLLATGDKDSLKLPKRFIRTYCWCGGCSPCTQMSASAW